MCALLYQQDRDIKHLTCLLYEMIKKGVFDISLQWCDGENKPDNRGLTSSCPTRRVKPIKGCTLAPQPLPKKPQNKHGPFQSCVATSNWTIEKSSLLGPAESFTVTRNRLALQNLANLHTYTHTHAYGQETNDYVRCPPADMEHSPLLRIIPLNWRISYVCSLRWKHQTALGQQNLDVGRDVCCVPNLRLLF